MIKSMNHNYLSCKQPIGLVVYMHTMFTACHVQLDAKDGEPESFVFQSPDALSSKKLMVIIHGSGVVRAGQWARRSDMTIYHCYFMGWFLLVPDPLLYT